MNKDYAEKEQMEDKIVDIKEKNEDEKQHHHNSYKDRRPLDIGPHLAVFGACAVNDHTHNGVVDCVENAAVKANPRRNAHCAALAAFLLKLGKQNIC